MTPAENEGTVASEIGQINEENVTSPSSVSLLVDELDQIIAVYRSWIDSVQTTVHPDEFKELQTSFNHANDLRRRAHIFQRLVQIQGPDCLEPGDTQELVVILQYVKSMKSITSRESGELSASLLDESRGQYPFAPSDMSGTVLLAQTRDQEFAGLGNESVQAVSDAPLTIGDLGNSHSPQIILALRQQVTQLEARLHDRETDLIAAEERATSLEKELKRAESELETERQHNADLQAEVATLSAQQQQEPVVPDTRAVEEAEALLVALKAERTRSEEAAKEATVLRARLARETQRRLDTEAELTVTRKRLAAAQAGAKENQIAVAKAEARALEAEARAGNAAGAAQSDLSAANEELLQLRARNAELAELAEGLDQRLVEVEERSGSTIGELRQRLGSVTAEHEELVRRFDELTYHCTELRSHVNQQQAMAEAAVRLTDERDQALARVAELEQHRDASATRLSKLEQTNVTLVNASNDAVRRAEERALEAEERARAEHIAAADAQAALRISEAKAATMEAALKAARDDVQRAAADGSELAGQLSAALDALREQQQRAALAEQRADRERQSAEASAARTQSVLAERDTLIAAERSRADQLNAVLIELRRTAARDREAALSEACKLSAQAGAAAAQAERAEAELAVSRTDQMRAPLAILTQISSQLDKASVAAALETLRGLDSKGVLHEVRGQLAELVDSWRGHQPREQQEAQARLLEENERLQELMARLQSDNGTVEMTMDEVDAAMEQLEFSLSHHGSFVPEPVTVVEAESDVADPDLELAIDSEIYGLDLPLPVRLTRLGANVFGLDRALVLAASPSGVRVTAIGRERADRRLLDYVRALYTPLVRAIENPIDVRSVPPADERPPEARRPAAAQRSQAQQLHQQQARAMSAYQRALDAQTQRRQRNSP